MNERTATAPPPAAPTATPPVFPKLPPALQSVLFALPEESWSKVRVVLVRTEEERELVELVPDMHRVMTFGPPRLVTRVMAGEIRMDEFDAAFARLHESLHGVRDAVRSLLEISGLGPPEAPGVGPAR